MVDPQFTFNKLPDQYKLEPSEHSSNPTKLETLKLALIQSLDATHDTLDSSKVLLKKYATEVQQQQWKQLSLFSKNLKHIANVCFHE